MTPPKSGPSAEPLNTAVCTMPSPYPRRSFGIETAISAVAAATVPVIAPSTNLKLSNCHGAVANAERLMVQNAANCARTSIGLRPYLSASAPQMGLVNAIMPAPRLRMSPVQYA